MLPGRTHKLILILLLVLISFAVYANSLGGDFLIDDYATILHDNRLHTLSGYLANTLRLKPHVFAEAAHAFIWHFWQDNPFYYHLFNVVFHALCVVLLFILFNILFSNINLSFLAGLIFAIHPIHTEAVSWISGGHYVFSSVFFLASFIFYIRSDRSIINLLWSAVFFGLCFLSGNSVAMLPVMFIFYEVFFRQHKKRFEKTSIMPRAAVLSLMCIVSAMLVGMFFVLRDRFIHTIFYFRGIRYLVVVTKAFVYYLGLLYLPVKRALYHPFAYNTTHTGRLSPAFFAGLAIIAICVYLFFRFRRTNKPLAFGIGFFFITYLPYSNIVPVCNIISERYMYLPSAGFCLVLSALFLKAWKIINVNKEGRKVLRILAMTALALFLLCYTILTVKHNSEYKDIATFWESNIKNFPEGYMAYNNLAGAFFAAGNIEQAIGYSWLNLAIKPEQPHVWSNLAGLYRQQADFKFARHCYSEALKLDSAYLPALKGLEEIKGYLNE